MREKLFLTGREKKNEFTKFCVKLLTLTILNVFLKRNLPTCEMMPVFIIRMKNSKTKLQMILKKDFLQLFMQEKLMEKLIIDMLTISLLESFLKPQMELRMDLKLSLHR